MFGREENNIGRIVLSTLIFYSLRQNKNISALWGEKLDIYK